MKHYSHCSVTRKGKKHGRSWKWKFWPFVKENKPLEPKTDQTIPAAYEQEIIEAGEADATKIAEKWQALDQKLKPAYCQSVRALEHAKRRFAKESGEAQAALAEFQVAEQKYKEMQMPNLDSKWRLFWLIIN